MVVAGVSSHERVREEDEPPPLAIEEKPEEDDFPCADALVPPNSRSCQPPNSRSCQSLTAPRGALRLTNGMLPPSPRRVVLCMCTLHTGHC